VALDPQHRRAFLSCEGNNVLTVFDLDAHKAIAHLPMAKGADVVMFDPGLGRIYVACSSGAISVFQMDDRRTSGSFRMFQSSRRFTVVR
jgi:DNA-binding beta-propeller fold protein YncE